MLRRVVKHNPMTLVAQKGCPAWLGVQDAPLALLAQLDIQIRLSCHVAHQTFRLMDVEIVDHKVPARRTWITGHHSLDVSQEIRLGACRTARGCNNQSTDHVATKD